MTITPSVPPGTDPAAPRYSANRSSGEVAPLAFPDDGSSRGDGTLSVRMAWSDSLLSVLFDVRNQVNDWLKYAETKNGAIVGLASAAMAIGFATLADRAADTWRVTVALTLAEACLLLSLLVGLASFLPRTNLTKRLTGGPGTPATDDNLLFYGDLAKYAPRPLVEAMAHRYDGGEPVAGSIDALHVDLAAQIVINARITLSKLRLFSYAVGLFALAILAFAAALIMAALA